MTIAEQNPADPGLKHLNGKTYDELLAWLEQALRGNEALPVVVLGEPPEDSILRHERKLATMTRGDLREACLHLVRRFVLDPSDDDDFVAALLRLAKGFSLSSVATDIHVLASAEERFSKLPPAQQRVLLTTLLDMGADVPGAFWSQLAARDPERFGVVAFSGVLRKEPAAVISLLPSLPDDERIADAIYVVLGQRTASLNSTERDQLVIAARAEARNAQPAIRAALNEWANEQPPVQQQEAPSVVDETLAKLAKALRDFAMKRGESYSPVPCSARLVPA